jgi:integrase
VKERIRKHVFRHFTGYEIATFFDKETGKEIFGPRQYLEYLAEAKGLPQNSLAAAYNDLFNFLNFMSACSHLQIESDTWKEKSGAYLHRILLVYPYFLAEAETSPNQIASAVAKFLEFEAVSAATVRRYISTLNQFLKFSDKEWLSQSEMLKHLDVDVFVSGQALMGELGQKTSLTKSEKKALLNQSMLAGVISGGPKKINRPKIEMPKRFKHSSKIQKPWYTKSFPINKVMDLIPKASSYRDVCLFSLLAGTGIRTHEAMQLRIEDILVNEESVQILPYSQRIGVYSDLDEVDVTKLAFKGRTHSDTYFIPVFRDIFFDNLYNYLDEREKTNPDHDFLFVVLANNARGNPWFKGDSTSHNRTFKSTQERMGGLDRCFTLHSLRHFFGTWMRNYEPNEAGFGFPLNTVRMAMGHEKENTTKSYSIPDKALELKKMANVEQFLIKHGYDRTQVMQLIEHGDV